MKRVCLVLLISGSGYEGQNLGIDAANIKDWLWLSGFQYIFE